MTAMAPAECGTYGGYKRHRSQDEDACTPCRRANAAYVQKYKRRNPESAARNAANQNLRNRAMRALVDRHRAEFDALLAEYRVEGSAQRG